MVFFLAAGGGGVGGTGFQGHIENCSFGEGLRFAKLLSRSGGVRGMAAVARGT